MSYVVCRRRVKCQKFFFFNDTATTEIYTLSLHDALPISVGRHAVGNDVVEHGLGFGVLALVQVHFGEVGRGGPLVGDRKSTRLNSSHANISYAVFCLKKKKIRDHIKSSVNESHYLDLSTV